MKTGTCIILAGGLGTRLKETIADQPKCLAPVAGHPFLHYLLRYLSGQGIGHIILSVGYLHEQVIRWSSLQKEVDQIRFVIEPHPLGTGGAIRLALEGLQEEAVFILNGDTYFGVNLIDLESTHRKNKAELTMALKQMEKPDRYGTVESGKDGRITGFREKQYRDQGMINGGIYLLDTRSFLQLRFPEIFSFERDYLEKQVHHRRFFGYPSAGYFIDIGIPEDYRKAQDDFTKGSHEITHQP
ncbi:MAG TPA: nucleotidyltransferase family protein [Chitinophagaceae bacterium]|nr:nucleotidyltransferase family protein [Chitinophagaceae bacterium]